MNRPLTIVIPAETYAPEVNGAATFAQQLAQGLAGRGHRVHVICPSPSGMAYHRADDCGVEVHYIKSLRWPLHPTWMICMPWNVAPAFDRLIDQIQPDIIHTQAHFVIGRRAFTTARRRHIPIVGTNHFMPQNVAPYVSAPGPIVAAAEKAAWWDLKKKYQSADYITVPTQLAADLLHQHGFDKPIRAVSCGIDLSHFHPADPAEDKAGTSPTILFVGRLSAEKHIEDIIEAIAKTDPALDLRAEIIGAGEQEKALADLADKLGVADRVVLRGKVSDAELVAAYQRADIFCMPSTAELQSIATLEALATGVPVVLADAVALPHLCEDGVNGRLIAPRDIDGYAQAFTEIATAPLDEREAMSLAAQKIAARHDISATLDTFEEIYSGCLQN